MPETLPLNTNLINEEPRKKKNYDFIDAIRGIAMLSIVMEHAVFFDSAMYHPRTQLALIIFCTFIQLIKYGTICFFLLSGFLIGEKFTDYSPAQYLKRRLDTTLVPWLFWSLVFLVTMIIDDYMRGLRSHELYNFFEKQVQYFPRHLKDVYLFSSYWFIPNFMICISILLIFKRYLYSYLFGGILLLFTLLYTVNIYYEWIEPRHSTAILGFVFFLWLGAQLNKNLAAFERWIHKTPVWIFLAICLISLIAGVKEELILRTLHSTDPYNSLRISSIIYALSFFMVLFKIKNYGYWVNIMKPRETTYGIYLIHFILVAQVLPMIFRPLKHSVDSLTTPELLGYQLTRFLIVYCVTFGLVTLINKTKFKWSVGR